MLYVGICFKKLDYEVVKKPIDADDLSDSEPSVDLEANHCEESEEGLTIEEKEEDEKVEDEKVEDEKVEDEKVEEEKEEEAKNVVAEEWTDQYRNLIGYTKEGIPIRVM